jgi:hypothetical protein
VKREGRRGLGATTILPGPLFKILVDGKPQSYRDTKLTAMGAAHVLKIRAPDNKVVVKDLQTGELTMVPAKD